MANVELGRNTQWKKWYPTVVPAFEKISKINSPYGEPNQETLALFADLPRGSKIGDIGGGEGRYALPLANMGHRVILSDVDLPHLVRGKEKNRLVGAEEGVIIPVEMDATKDFPMRENSLEAVLNAGFGYLIPPDELGDLFGKMVKVVKPGGLIVFEFATNRDRRDRKDGKSLIGREEYIYSKQEGLEVLGQLFDQHALEHRVRLDKTIHFEESYFMHNDLVIVAGKKPTKTK